MYLSTRGELNNVVMKVFLLQPPDPALGTLGPTLRALVGDTIQITFQNNCPFTTGMHPHGVFYMKDSEGSPYDDNEGGMCKLLY